MAQGVGVGLAGDGQEHKFEKAPRETQLGVER